MLDAWKMLIESNARELAVIPDFEQKELNFFKNGRLSYFRNDVEGLKKALIFFTNNKSESVLNNLCAEVFKLRLWIRGFDLQESCELTYNSSEKFISSEDPVIRVLLVELLSVEAMVCDLKKNYDLSSAKNMRAFKFAESLDLNKKSSITYYNGVVAQNHKASHHLRLSKLSDAIIMAQENEDMTTVIAARTSLSNEYEILGCYNLAYEEIKKALDVATEHQYGSFNHGACLLSYAKICISLGRLDLAKESLVLVGAFDFNEFKSAVFELHTQLEESQTMSPAMLSGDGQRVIEILSQGPKAKYDIIELLYGEGDFESFDNRFKQLLVRVRKKKGLIIVFNKVSSMYELIL